MATEHHVDPSKLGALPVAPGKQPEWAEVYRFMSEAAAAGENVQLGTRLETMTPAGAAGRLNLSRSTISRRISTGEIKAIKVGNRHRTTMREFERFRDSLMQEMVGSYADDTETDLRD